MTGNRDTGVFLYWLPLGAGGHFVRWNGRVYEAVVARYQHRQPQALYHSALEVRLRGDRYTIEMGPAWGNSAKDRGVVKEGPVGLRFLGHAKFFRYEIRRWQDGVIPDLAEAVGEPHIVSDDEFRARRVLNLVAHLPTPTWGRDELNTQDMWNSNSMVSWLLARSGHDIDSVQPPAGGRAPGWSAGLVVAARQMDQNAQTLDVSLT